MPLVRLDLIEPPPPELVELAGDDDDLAVLAPAELLLAALARDEPLGLELVGEHVGPVPVVRTLLRAGGPAARARVGAAIRAAFPQATPRWWRPDVATSDPAAIGPDERAAACEFRLSRPAYEPIALPRDRDQDPRLAPQADPLLGVLAALQSLPPGWRGLAQLVVRRAPDGWAEPHRDKPSLDPTVERARATARASGGPAGGGDAPSLRTSLTLFLILAAGYGAYQAVGSPVDLVEQGRFASLGLYGLALAGPVALVTELARRVAAPPLTYDPALVRDKLAQRAFFFAQLRLAVIAPAATPVAELAAALARLADAYAAYDQPLGNRFGRRPLAVRHPRQLTWPRPAGGEWRRDPWRGRDVLGARELAGLWHPTAQASGLAGVARRDYPTRLPAASAVSGGCRIGVSPHHGLNVPVAVPDAVLDQHLFLLAGTQQGKSSLLLRLADNLMARRDRTLVVVDPHHRLGWGVLGLAPADRRDDVVYLDAANADRPFGLNLLDAGLFATADAAVEGLLRILQKQFPDAWGPRMEDAFRAAARLLFCLNQRRLAAARAAGIPARAARERQFTILDVTEAIADDKWRATLLREAGDPALTRWWARYLKKHAHLRDEIVNPVTSKVDYLALNDRAAAILGQPRTTVDPRAWLERPHLVVVHTALGELKEAMAGLLGGVLINLLAQLVVERARPARGPRPPATRLTLIVDEFQTIPSGDYRTILSQLAKFGANAVLATQTLTALDGDAARGRPRLRGEVFTNTGGWFGFRGDPTEDHRAVALALGGGLTADDLNNLPPYHCYARWSVDAERPPAFLVRLDPPPVGDDTWAWELADDSAGRCGSDPAAIAGWRLAALTRAGRTAPAANGTAGGDALATSGQPPPVERASAARATPVSAAPGARARAAALSDRRRRRPAAPPPPAQSALPRSDALPGTPLTPTGHPPGRRAGEAPGGVVAASSPTADDADSEDAPTVADDGAVDDDAAPTVDGHGDLAAGDARDLTGAADRTVGAAGAGEHSANGGEREATTDGWSVDARPPEAAAGADPDAHA